jgi:LacI family transcriptional regulator
MATIRDVARESGVSVATVSYVLNNGPRPVAPATRDRVLDVVRRMNYHPNAAAQRLNGRQMRTLGLLFGCIESDIVTNAYAAMLLQGIVSAAARACYNVTLFTMQWEGASASAPAFKDGRTDGVIVVAPETDSDVVEGLAALGIPLVCVSGPSGVPGVPFVDVDNATGGRIAAEYLLSLGHERVAYLGGDENHADVPARRRGFVDAMTSAGHAPPPEYLPPGTYERSRAQEIACRLLRLPRRPTAVFAASDTLAILLLETARELGLRVPEDLSVLGFDDLTTASLVSPPLTTVRQPLGQIGACAARLLVRQVETGAEAAEDALAGPAFGGVPAFGGIVFAPELVVRGSCAAPR